MGMAHVQWSHTTPCAYLTVPSTANISPNNAHVVEVDVGLVFTDCPTRQLISLMKEFTTVVRPSYYLTQECDQPVNSHARAVENDFVFRQGTKMRTAQAGNRTPVTCVGGKYDTTTPLAHAHALLDNLRSYWTVDTHIQVVRLFL